MEYADGRPDRHVVSAGGQQESGYRGAGGAGTTDHDAGGLERLAHDAKRVDQGCEHHGGGAVLVIVDHGDVKKLSEAFLHREASRGRDVLEIDAAERRGDRDDRSDDLVHVLGVEADRNRINLGEPGEQRGLAFHHWQSREGSEVAQAQNGGPVGDHGHPVGSAGQLVDSFGSVCEQAGDTAYPWRVGEGEILSGVEGDADPGLGFTASTERQNTVRTMDQMEVQPFAQLRFQVVQTLLGVSGEDQPDPARRLRPGHLDVHVTWNSCDDLTCPSHLAGRDHDLQAVSRMHARGAHTVSYTHLTLPTIYSV